MKYGNIIWNTEVNEIRKYRGKKQVALILEGMNGINGVLSFDVSRQDKLLL